MPAVAQAMIDNLGTGVVMKEEDTGTPASDDDVIELVLQSKDLPDTTAGDIVVKIGSSDLKKALQHQVCHHHHHHLMNPYSSCDLKDYAAEPSRTSEDGDVLLYDPLDFHRFECGVVLEVTREFGNFWGEAPFPFYVSDQKVMEQLMMV